MRHDTYLEDSMHGVLTRGSDCHCQRSRCPGQDGPGSESPATGPHYEASIATPQIQISRKGGPSSLNDTNSVTYNSASQNIPVPSGGLSSLTDIDNSANSNPEISNRDVVHETVASTCTSTCTGISKDSPDTHASERISAVREADAQKNTCTHRDMRHETHCHRKPITSVSPSKVISRRENSIRHAAAYKSERTNATIAMTITTIPDVESTHKPMSPNHLSVTSNMHVNVLCEPIETISDTQIVGEHTATKNTIESHTCITPQKHEMKRHAVWQVPDRTPARRDAAPPLADTRGYKIRRENKTSPDTGQEEKNMCFQTQGKNELKPAHKKMSQKGERGRGKSYVAFWREGATNPTHKKMPQNSEGAGGKWDVALWREGEYQETGPERKESRKGGTAHYGERGGNKRTVDPIAGPPPLREKPKEENKAQEKPIPRDALRNAMQEGKEEKQHTNHDDEQ